MTLLFFALQETRSSGAKLPPLRRSSLRERESHTPPSSSSKLQRRDSPGRYVISHARSTLLFNDKPGRQGTFLPLLFLRQILVHIRPVWLRGIENEVIRHAGLGMEYQSKLLCLFYIRS
jgi:hypothetical protein